MGELSGNMLAYVCASVPTFVNCVYCMPNQYSKSCISCSRWWLCAYQMTLTIGFSFIAAPVSQRKHISFFLFLLNSIFASYRRILSFFALGRTKCCPVCILDIKPRQTANGENILRSFLLLFRLVIPLIFGFVVLFYCLPSSCSIFS